jgi:phage shock protein E
MKPTLILAVAALLSLCCWFAPAISAADHTKDSLETIKKNLAAKKAILVDVREKDEWDDGHLKQASLMPLSEIPAKASGKMLEKQFPKGTILYLHCASGRRCLKAADILQKNGYDARALSDGYQALLKKGFEKAE